MDKGSAEIRKRKRMATNFEKTYGKTVFLAFLDGLERGESGGLWATRLNVSRERVRHWRDVFVIKVVHIRRHRGLLSSGNSFDE